jgi:hypothetical protein
MIALNRRHLLVGVPALAVLGLSSCTGPQAVMSISLTIDWVPSAEYYGFFVAKSEGIFAQRGFDVAISNGTGAPAVANQLGSNAISQGTTTSDNLVRIIARGAGIERATPILPFNPATLITRPGEANLRALTGKTIGVNVQSAAYSQFLKALATAHVPHESIREYPVGFGGVDEFASGRIHALVGYTSNHAVDLTLRSVPFDEARFDSLGVSSAGLVLAATTQAAGALTRGRLTDLFAACLAGYTLGANDPAVAVRALRGVDPTLDARKLDAAVRKISSLARHSVIRRWDDWLRGERGITENAIESSNSLLSRSYARW